MFEKEAEEYVKQNYCEMCIMADDCKCGCIDCFTVSAYLASAEPREKRIADLEKENAELKENLKTAYRKGMRHMAKALKDYDRTDGAWTDYFEHTVDKVLQREQLDFEEYGTLADQLTKAKVALRKVVDYLGQFCSDYPDCVIEAEKILKEE